MTEVISEKNSGKNIFPKLRKYINLDFQVEIWTLHRKNKKTTPGHITMKYLKITKTNLKVKRRQGK